MFSTDVLIPPLHPFWQTSTDTVTTFLFLVSCSLIRCETDKRKSTSTVEKQARGACRREATTLKVANSSKEAERQVSGKRIPFILGYLAKKTDTQYARFFLSLPPPEHGNITH